MNIEISCTNYWKELNYRDALLYCSLLCIDGKTDWRLPTDGECEVYELYDEMTEYANHMSSVWTLSLIHISEPTRH